MELSEKSKIFIAKGKSIYGDKYDYSKVDYINNRKEVIIICDKHGEFLQSPKYHLKGFACKNCNNNNKSNTEEFINKAKIIHNDKYDYSQVKYINSRTKIIIICPKHGTFNQLPNSHLSRHGCKICKLESQGDKTKYTNNEFIEKCKTIHGDKYDYTEVNYVNSHTKITIICPLHNRFHQNPSNHLIGQGCPKCGIETVANSRRSTTAEFIEKAKQIHENKYDYSKVNYINNSSKVIIICPLHGEFYQDPNHHLKKSGCPNCGYKIAADKIKLTTFEFIERSKIIHGDKYNYSEVNYVHNDLEVTIICSLHGLFTQKPYIHLQGRGCPKCNLCPKCQLWRTMGELCSYCKNIEDKKMHQKTKELRVVRFLKQALPDHEFIHNKSVGKDCTDGHLFPDIRFDCGYYHLIVEVDEHKHRGSNYECDEQRMRDIIAKLGQPCIFIRYNPDNQDSDKNVLLDTIEEYIDLDNEFNEDMFDDYGLRCIYLFY